MAITDAGGEQGVTDIEVSGEIHSFLERLLFPYLVYSGPPQTIFPKKIRTAWIYTINLPEEITRPPNYDRLFEVKGRFLQMIFGHAESLMWYDTNQFEDYAKMVATRFNVDELTIIFNTLKG